MKKLFTMIAICTASFVVYIASAGTPFHLGKIHATPKTISPTVGNSISALRSVSCDTLSNLMALDTPFIVTLDSPNVGYISGNGAVDFSGSLFTIIGVGERYTAPAGIGRYVSAALVDFAIVVINRTHADSILPVTAYVYDTTGTSPAGGYAPGHAIDSATVTLESIASDSITGTVFTFTHQAALPASGFFITIKLPNATGDTLAVTTNDGWTGNGQAWIEANLSGGAWVSDASAGSPLGNFIFPVVCGSACPTITVTATQIGTSSSAYATATGGTAPYTYAWSNSQTTDTATSLTTHTYTVTATDHNGCTGTGTVAVTTGIVSIGDITDFSIYPNPSNGVFTASVHLASSSNVTISIMDITGNKIYETTDNAVKDLNKQINLGTIATGMYFVNVKTANGSVNQRIVVR